MQATKETLRSRNGAPAAAGPKKTFREWMRKNGTGYAFLLPFLILFAVFVIVPVAVAMYYSLTN